MVLVGVGLEPSNSKSTLNMTTELSQQGPPHLEEVGEKGGGGQFL